jgi:hypothetical protein
VVVTPRSDPLIIHAEKEPIGGSSGIGDFRQAGTVHLTVGYLEWSAIRTAERDYASSVGQAQPIQVSVAGTRPTDIVISAGWRGIISTIEGADVVGQACLGRITEWKTPKDVFVCSTIAFVPSAFENCVIMRLLVESTITGSINPW